MFNFCILYRYFKKRAVWKFRGQKWVTCNSGHYESSQDYRVWDLKIFITENIRELVVSGWKDMLTEKKQGVWEKS